VRVHDVRDVRQALAVAHAAHMTPPPGQAEVRHA
jgi:dihydropteroate synthase